MVWFVGSYFDGGDGVGVHYWGFVVWGFGKEVVVGIP